MNNNYDALGYYQVLEVAYNAPTSLIKQQYYSKAKYWHPDHNENPKALEIFQKISVAYDVLKEDKSRLQYDLLCCVYQAADFPQMGALKIYKNQKDKDDIALRVLKQRKVHASFKETKVEERRDICNIKEAKDMVILTSIFNWLCGWWGKNALHKNIEAIKFNLNSVYADDLDNLKLLIHNALAYEQENRLDMAWLYAKQAQRLAQESSRISLLLDSYISSLNYQPQKTVNIPYWSANELKYRQYLMPISLIILIMTAFVGFLQAGGWVDFSRKANMDSYYEEMEFSNGALVSYDMIESRIVQLDSSITDSEFIYHLNKDASIYHGPDNRYDVMQKGVNGQTVRVTGHTANKAWIRIIVDSGEAGYIFHKHLDKGFGNPLPPRSRVYQNK